MNSITNRQIIIDLFASEGGFRFEYEGNLHHLPNIDKIHAFFRRQPFDTVKLCQGSQHKYLHFSNDEVKIFDSKKALRRTTSQESGGAWIEEKRGKKRYFVDDSGWFQTSHKQVSKEEFLQKLESPSTMQKVMGIGLGILALLPVAFEIKDLLPFRAKEAGLGLLALQQKSPLLGALGYSLLPISIEAQAVGTEFQVNNYSTSSQSNPAIVPTNDGGFVVVWQSSGQDGDGWGIFAQRYDATGALFGSEFQVNNFTTSLQSNPAIAPKNDGGFVIAWESRGQDGGNYGIFAQKYDATGTFFGSEFQVNNFTSTDQTDPAIAPLNNGGYVITWTSFGQDGDGFGVFGQLYEASGALFNSEFQINNYNVSNQLNSAVSKLNNGGFIVIWDSFEQDGINYGIFGQKYDANGTLFGSEFQVNNYTTSDQRLPAVRLLQDGGFVVAWQSEGQDGNLTGIFAQRYDNNGALFASEFQVNNYTIFEQKFPALASLNDGGFVVVWQSWGQDGDAWGIFAQRYDAFGALYGSEFQVNSFTIGDQRSPAIASLNDGGFVVVWQSSGQDIDSEGIFGQRYDHNANPIPLTHPSSMSSTSSLSSKAVTINVPSTQLIPSISPNTTNNLSSSTNTRSLSSSTDSIQSASTTHTYTSLGSGILSLGDVLYDQNYPVFQSGQTIGTFTISGGAGLYSSNNPNTLNFEIDPNIVLQDGDTYTLFSLPQGEEILLEEIILSSDCFSAEGEQVYNEQTYQNDFQLIFNTDGPSCTFYASGSRLYAVSALTFGGLL